MTLKCVDWWVTSQCNLRCGFCYGPSPATPDDTSATNLILKRIGDSFARTVTICGGEPLVRPDLGDVLEALADGHKQIILNTNGELLTLRALHDPRVLDLPAVFGVSIDGPDQVIHGQMRGMNADFGATLSAVRTLKRMGKTVKVGTVVTRSNISSLGRLGRLVAALSPAVWRIYQYAPRSWQGNYGRYVVPDADFSMAVQEASKACGAVPLRSSSGRDTEGCFIIDNRGRYLLPESRNYVVVGSAVHDGIDEVFNLRWQDKEKLVRNKDWHSVLRGPRDV